MSDEIRKSLLDILQSIDVIEEYLGEKKDFTFYQSNRLIRDAVERRLEIIGEATNRILKLDSHVSITHARRIVDMRNKVIHAYDLVDNPTVWAVIVHDLPILKIEIVSLLGS
jgi:uncharacterized protein with HEPN domain